MRSINIEATKIIILRPTQTKPTQSPGFSFDFFSRAYLSRLAVALLFFLFSAYTCAVASMVAGHRTPYVMILDLDGRYGHNRRPTSFV